MNGAPSRKKQQEWPKKVRCGRESVTVYRRTMPNGALGFMVSNYADGKRRFDSYADESDALKAANTLARQLSEREVAAAAMTNEQAAEYAAAIQSLAPYSVSLPSTASTVARRTLRITGGCSLL